MKIVITLIILILSASHILAEIKSDNNEIRFIGSHNPPFEYIDEDGNIAGFHIDLVKSVCKVLNLKYNIELKNWEDAKESIQKEDSDVIMGINYSSKRAEIFHFGLPHNYMSIGIVTKNKTNINSLSKLKGKTVVVIKGSYSEEFLENNNYGVIFHKVETVDEALKLVANGFGDVMVCNNIIARYNINNKKLELNVNEVVDIAPIKYCMAVKSGNEDLIILLNSGIAKLRLTGEIDSIYDKWFGEYNVMKLPKWFYNMIFITMILAIITIIFIYMLNRQVRIKTKKIGQQARYISDMNNKLTELNLQLNVILENSNASFIQYNSDLEITWENLRKNNNFKNKTFCIQNNRYCNLSYSHNDFCKDCALFKSLASKKIEISKRIEEDGKYTQITAIPVVHVNEVVSYILKFEDITSYQMIVNDLISAKSRAEESDKLKSSFLANISHEIRTPLNAIVGFSDLMGEALTQKEKSLYKNLITHNGDLLLRLINDVLDLSKIESGILNFDYETFNVQELFYIEIIRYANENIKAGIKIVDEIDLKSPLVTLDKNRFIQIAFNFISNALKYTDQGTITIGIKHIDKGLKLYVKDTGRGISQENHHLIFTRFEKLDSFVQGSGLGLAICKAVMDSIGGTIGFESEENVGSTFWALFPCDEVTEKDLVKSEEKLVIS